MGSFDCARLVLDLSSRVAILSLSSSLPLFFFYPPFSLSPLFVLRQIFRSISCGSRSWNWRNWFVSSAGRRLEKFGADFTPKYFVRFIRADADPISRGWNGPSDIVRRVLSLSLGCHSRASPARQSGIDMRRSLSRCSCLCSFAARTSRR